MGAVWPFCSDKKKTKFCLSTNWVRTLLDRFRQWAKVEAANSRKPPTVFFLMGASKPLSHPCFYFPFVFFMNQIIWPPSLPFITPCTTEVPSEDTAVDSQAGQGEKKGPSPKHDHMFKPCPVNPKQDVAAGPPVRRTDTDTQEAHCLPLI